jgi:putative aldouronate transport system substrate-binding protein
MYTKKVNKKRAAWLLALIVASTAVLSACGGANQASNQGQSDKTNGEAPTEITIMSHFFSPTPPSSTNEVKQEIEKATNTKLNINWVSSNNYGDKFNVTLASGDIPDLILVRDPFDPVFRKAAEQGAFWDVSSYIKDYPNLSSKIAPIAWELTKINGANFGVPRPRPSEAEQFLIVRKDWLDKLGLQPPTNTEELYTVMRAFTEQDPDGNGIADTVGLAGQMNPTDMGTFKQFEHTFTGAFGEWKVQDGALVHVALLPESREALELLEKAHNEKLIPLDAASLKITQVKDMFKAGKAGILEEKAGTLQEYYDALKAADPSFEFSNFLPLTNVNGYNPKSPGFSGMNAIPKSVPEEKMKKILAMIDKWSEDEIFIMHQQGVEGIHHTVNNGEVTVNSEKILADAIGDFNQIVYVADPYASSVKPGFPEDIKKLFADIQDVRAKTSVEDISIGLYSETGMTYLPEFRKKLQDLKTKIILGREPIEAWDTFVEKLKSDADFVKMTEEMNQAYQNR